MKRLLYSLGIILLSVLTSCEREELNNIQKDNQNDLNSGKFISIPAMLAVNPFNAGTDTVGVKAEVYKSNEYKIENFWLLQFDGTSDDSKFLAATYHPHASTMEQSWVKMDESQLASTKCVWIVANTNHISTSPFGSYEVGTTTLGQFKQDGLPIEDVDDLGAPLATAEQVNAGYSIPLSGWSEFDASKNNLEIKLKSIVSKLTINYSLGASTNYTLNTIKLYRVPSKLSYSPESVSPTTYKLLTYEYLITAPTSNSGTITLYIPQNRQQATVNTNGSLSNAADSPKTKTENAPAKATYFSLGLTKTSGEKTAINIFPGGNDDGATNAYDCYEVLANAHYNETVNVTTTNVDSYLVDTNDDSRLIEIQKQTITSNCYIVNPLLSGETETDDYYASVNREECYALPVVHRVNEGWAIGNSAKVLGTNDEWMMHVVWQDQPGRLVYFVESSGLKAWRNKEGEILYHMPVQSGNNPNNTNYAKEFYGRGIGDNGYVYVYAERSPARDNYKRGNVLIALRKKDPNGSFTAENGEKYGEILWSWHLWVTDYNPDKVLSKPGTYTGIVRGNMENGTASNRRSRVFKYGFWTGNYNYSWIMDRNLGARGWMPAGMAEANGKDGTEGFGLFYQWGRKDPFPGGNPAQIVQKDLTFGPANLNNGSDVVSDGYWNSNGVYVGSPAATGNRLVLHRPVVVNGESKNLLTLYDIYGIAKNSLSDAFEIESNNELTDIWGTMKSPHKIYGSNIRDYLPSDHSYSGNNWNNPPTYSPLDPNTKTKTLFDPCPPGWEIPVDNVFYGDGSGFINTKSKESQENVRMGDNYYVENYSNDIRSFIVNVAPSGALDNSYNCTYFPRAGWISSGGQRDLRGLCDLWCVESKSGQSLLGSYIYIGRGLDVNVKEFVQPTIHISTTSTSSVGSYFAKKNAFGVRCVKR